MSDQRTRVTGNDLPGPDTTQRIASLDVWMDTRERVYEDIWFLGHILDTSTKDGERAVQWECGYPEEDIGCGARGEALTDVRASMLALAVHNRVDHTDEEIPVTDKESN